jgi:tetratricopeptide (TPR) repeat protein
MRVAGLLLVAAGLSAEPGILVVHIKDTQGRVVRGVQLAPEGDGGAGPLTDAAGKTRIRLAPQTRSGARVTLQIVKAARDLVFISPWDRRVTVPPFENEAENYAAVVVGERGDRTLLESGDALRSLAANLNKTVRSTLEEQRREDPLAEVARQFGLPPVEIDEAIRAWGARTEDPYEKGLAALYEKNYPVATARLEESLEQREAALKKDQAAVADAAFFLGNSLHEQGKYREANARYERAAALRPDDDVVLNNWGLSLTLSGEYGEAESVLRRALAISEKLRGDQDPETGTRLDNLAALLHRKGAYVAAEPLHRRALTITEKAQGAEHPDTGTRLNNLAELLRAKGDYAAAEPLHRRALAIAEKTLGPDHAVTGTRVNNLALLLKSKGDYTAAEPLYRRALAIVEQTRGREHPETGMGLNNLAQLLRAKGDNAAAEPLYRRALAIAEKAQGPDHPITGMYLKNLAEFLSAKGDYAAAESMFQRALAILEGALGPEHELTQKARTGLDALQRQRKDGTK